MVERYDEQLFLEYVEGELPHDKRLAFENQMLQDPRLRNLVAQMVLDRHRLRTMPDEQPPAHLMDVVHERLERSMLLGDRPAPNAQIHTAQTGQLRWRRIGVLVGMAAMFALVASVFLTTLVSLSQETPMSDMGSGTLLPPGIRPTQPLTTTIPPQPKSDTPETPGQAEATITSPSQTSTASSNTPADIQGSPSPVEITAVPVQPQPLDTESPTTATAMAPSADLPEVDLIMQLTTSQPAVTERRLTRWIEAYQAQILDTRPMTASTAPATQQSGSHQPLMLPPPAPRQAQAISIRLPEPMVSHLRTFLGSVSGGSFAEWTTAAASESAAQREAFKGLESLFPTSQSPLDWLVIPTPSSRPWDAQDTPVMPPLKPQSIGDDSGIVEVRIELIAAE